MVMPRPTITTSRPGDRNLVEREQRLDARRACTTTGPGHPQGETPDVGRVHAVDVLVGVDARSARPRSRCARAPGYWKSMASTSWSSFISRTAAHHVGLRRVGGQVDVRRVGTRAPRPCVASWRRSAAAARRRRRATSPSPGVCPFAISFSMRGHEIGEHRVGDRATRHHLGRHVGRPRRPYRLGRSQWRKCRSPVNTMARPSSSAFSITFSSPTEPPGWMTTATPASAAASMPSGNG